MKNELMDKKFAKLSDANKIRFNIGVIIFTQTKIVAMIFSSFLIIISYLFMLPFIIRYGGFNQIMGYVDFSFILLITTFILLILGIFRQMKDRKVLEKFLDKKSKK